MRFLKQLWSNEEGQDLIEYTLLLAFVALVAAGLFINAGQSVSGIWGTASSRLAAASTAGAS
ncbi:MAG: Flp family type IVb pilin [Acidobacteriia bacterium]|nr:Flp family type IVb pilin [Terriglobia bacterium]